MRRGDRSSRDEKFSVARMESRERERERGRENFLSFYIFLNVLDKCIFINALHKYSYVNKYSLNMNFINNKRKLYS